MVVKVVRPRPRPEEEEGQAAVEETEEAVIAGKKNVYERERDWEKKLEELWNGSLSTQKTSQDTNFIHVLLFYAL